MKNHYTARVLKNRTTIWCLVLFISFVSIAAQDQTPQKPPAPVLIQPITTLGLTQLEAALKFAHNHFATYQTQLNNLFKGLQLLHV